MEMTVTADGRNNEKVPYDGDQIHPQEQPQKNFFLLWLPRESQKKEFCDYSLVVFVHVCRGENTVKSKRKNLMNWICNFFNDSRSKVCFLINITSNIKLDEIGNNSMSSFELIFYTIFITL